MSARDEPVKTSRNFKRASPFIQTITPARPGDLIELEHPLSVPSS